MAQASRHVQNLRTGILLLAAFVALFAGSILYIVLNR